MPLLLMLVSYIAFALALPFLLAHPKLRQGIAARFGFYGDTFRNLGDGPRIWVHGASAGDILALLPTVRELKRCHPSIEVIATTITNSGHTMAMRHNGLFAAVTYFPYDLPGTVRRALRRIDPHVLVLEYTELWPNLIHAAAGRQVPVVLHNGRLAAARVRQYRRLFALTGNLLTPLTLLLMRDDAEAERALALGAPADRVHVTGNTKFDNLAELPRAEKVAELRAAAGFPADAPIWVAGSTHEGEEEKLLDVFATLRQSTPALRLILAPRYAERGDKLLSLALRRGYTARLRSHAGPPADVLILDTIGELAACYTLATLVFVGGSFVARGGQNILEPAACGKPVIFGPHMQNFADSVQVLLGRGGIQVATPEQLQRVMRDLLQHDSYRHELGDIAKHQVGTIRGAALRNANYLGLLLQRRETPEFALSPIGDRHLG